MTLKITRSTLLRTAGAAGLATALAPIAHGQTAMPGKMHLRIIPSSGAQLPVVGCGTWRTFDVGSQPKDRAPLAEVLCILFEAGGSVIDSSPMYGAAEGVVAGIEGAEVLGREETGVVAVGVFEPPQPVRAALVMAAARPVAALVRFRMSVPS